MNYIFYIPILLIIILIILLITITVKYNCYRNSRKNFLNRSIDDLIEDNTTYPNINLQNNNTCVLARYMYQKVSKGYKINISLVLNLYKIYQQPLKNWYTKNICIPKYLFLSLLIDEESISKKPILDLIDEILKSPQNIRDDLANGYEVIVYYKVYDYLRKKYNLKPYPDIPKIDKILNTKLDILDIKTDGIINGIYNDGSFIYHTNVPYNTSYLIGFFQSMLIIRNLEIKSNKDVKMLNKNLDILAASLIPFVYGRFINYNGAGRAITRQRYKDLYQDLLYNLYLYNSSITDYKYFDSKDDDHNFYNIDKMYLLAASGMFAWYGRKYEIYIINCYREKVENEVYTNYTDGDLVVKQSNYTHSILLGDEDLHLWYSNDNKKDAKIILAGCIMDNTNKIINIRGNMEYYDKIDGDNLKTIKIVSNWDLILYYIINRNLSLISIVIINPKKKPFYYYPVSVYQNSNFIISNTSVDNNTMYILSELRPRYLKIDFGIDTEKSVIEINNDHSVNNYGRIKCYIESENCVMHISTKQFDKIPDIGIKKDEPIYT